MAEKVLRQLTHDVTGADGVWQRESELRTLLRAVREGCLSVASASNASASEAQAVRAWLTRLVALVDGPDAKASTAALRLLSVSVAQLGEDHAVWAGEQLPTRVLRALKAGTPSQRAAAMQCGTCLVERLTAQGKQGPLKKVLASSALVPAMVALLVPTLALDPRLARAVTATLKRCLAAAPAAMAQKGDALREVVPALMWASRPVLARCGADLMAALPWMDASGASWGTATAQCFATLAVLTTKWLNDGGPQAANAAPDALVAGLPPDSSLAAFGTMCDATACLLSNAPPAAASVTLATHTAVAHFVRVLSCAARLNVSASVAWPLVRHTLPVLRAYVRLARGALLLHHSALMEALLACHGWALAECAPAAGALCEFYATDYIVCVPVGHVEGALFTAIVETLAAKANVALLASLVQHRPGLWAALAQSTRSAIETALCAQLLSGDASAVAGASALLQCSVAPQSGRALWLLREWTASAALALALRPPAPQWPTGGVSGASSGEGARPGTASVFATAAEAARAVVSSHEAAEGSDDDDNDDEGAAAAADNEGASDRQPLKRAPSPISRPDTATKVARADEWQGAASTIAGAGGDVDSDVVDDDDDDDDDNGDALVQIVNEASSE